MNGRTKLGAHLATPIRPPTSHTAIGGHHHTWQKKYMMHMGTCTLTQEENKGNARCCRIQRTCVTVTSRNCRDPNKEIRARYVWVVRQSSGAKLTVSTRPTSHKHRVACATWQRKCSSKPLLLRVVPKASDATGCNHQHACVLQPHHNVLHAGKLIVSVVHVNDPRATDGVSNGANDSATTASAPTSKRVVESHYLQNKVMQRMPVNNDKRHCTWKRCRLLTAQANVEWWTSFITPVMESAVGMGLEDVAIVPEPQLHERPDNSVNAHTNCLR